MRKNTLIYITLIFLVLSSQIQGKQKFLGNQKDRSNLITNPLKESLLQNSMEEGTHQRTDFYLWEEGVTNLAYDDFLTTKFITNIEYLGSGYNLAYGNPHSTSSIDPGFRNERVFQFNYAEDKLKALSGDADFFVPHGVNVQTKTSCQISFDSKEVSSSQEYSSSLSASMNIAGGGFGFAFKASAEYSQAEEGLQKEDTSFVESSATCSVHNLKISKQRPPLFSENFVAALEELLDDNSPENFYEFFEDWGTHVTIAVDLGSLFGYQFEMKKSEVQQMKQQGFSVSVGASGWGMEGGASTEFQQSSKSAFSSAMQSWKTFSIGAPPNENNDVMAWASQSATSPMPIKGTFVTWPVFLKRFGKNEGNSLTADQISSLIQGFQDNINTYCDDYLLPMGELTSCAVEIPQSQGEAQQSVQIPDNKDKGLFNGSWKHIESGGNSICVDGNGASMITKGTTFYLERTGETKFWQQNQQADPNISCSHMNLISVFNNGRLVYYNFEGQMWYQDMGSSVNALVASINENAAIAFISNQNNKYQIQTLDSKDDSSPSVIYETEQNVSQWIQYNGNKIAFQADGKQYLIKGSAVLKVSSFPNMKQFCVTAEGWAYSLDNNGAIYFQDSYELGSPLTKIDGKLHKIDCSSGPNGPQLAGYNSSGNVYKRAK